MSQNVTSHKDDEEEVLDLVKNEEELIFGEELIPEINADDIFTSDELVLEYKFANVEGFDDLSVFLGNLEERYGIDFPNFLSGTRENIIISTNDTSQVMVFDSDAPTTAIIKGGSDLKAGTVSGDVALFLTEGNIELDLAGGTTTAFVENLQQNDIILSGSKGDIILSVLSDDYESTDYSLKDGQLFRGDEKLQVFFEDIENFDGSFIIKDVMSNSLQVLIEGEKKAFNDMEEGLRDFFVVSDDFDSDSDLILGDELGVMDDEELEFSADEALNELDLVDLGNEIFADNEITINTSKIDITAGSLSAAEELLEEYNNPDAFSDNITEVDVKLQQQTEKIFDDFVSNDLVAAFINDDAIDIIMDE